MKYYTEEGNWDLVGNNTPVFFIRDPLKFPDFIHTQKREPHTNLKSPTMMWDFWSLSPESLHQVTILFSDRGLPQGYRFVNAGVNGELAYNALQRLAAVTACRPSWITLMVGTNDVYAALSTANAHETMEQMGLPERPTRETFRRYLTEICLQLRNATAAPLALLSLPPLGEDPAHHAFQLTAAYTRIIQSVAHETGCAYLPVHERMRAYLDNHGHQPGRSFGEYRDGMGLAVKVRRFLLHQSFDAISRRNGFCLLTDFFHLNDAGAAIVADAVT